jgi:hypothetical protein
MSVTPSPFDLATAELRKLGIALRQLPGEYSVNFINGSESTAHIAENLDDALALGRAMATERAEAGRSSRGPRYRRPRRMTPKAYNKRLRMAHMRRLRAQAKQKPAHHPSGDDPAISHIAERPAAATSNRCNKRDLQSIRLFFSQIFLNLDFRHLAENNVGARSKCHRSANYR